MLRFKKCDKKFPRMESESRDENEPQDPGPRVERGEMTRHRYLVTATILASPQRAAAQQDQQMLRWIHSPGQWWHYQPEMCFITAFILLLMWAVLRARLTSMQWAGPSCRTIAAMCCRSQLFIGYWCMEAWRGPRVCDWPSGKQMLTCRYCHWARQATMSLFKESS